MESAGSRSRPGPWFLFFSIAILLACAAIYLPTLRFGFSAYDDPVLVAHNVHVREGPTRAGIVWALGSFEEANWHPATWISWMIDARLGGMNPSRFHATNLLLHALSAIVLLLALDRLTGSPGRSGIVALLFAVHSFHVESVAWIAERKDLLSGLFFALTLLAYARYARGPSVGRYTMVAAAFLLGLASKPMLVTTPLILWLLDVWPLGRIVASRAEFPRLRSLVIVEKIPLLALALASGLVTIAAQRSAGALEPFGATALSARAANACIAYALYLGKTLNPWCLAVFYPLPREGWPLWAVAASVLLLVVISVFAVMQFRMRPWIAIGWLWFVIMLLPVIGLVRVGMQAMADRYMYLPLIGLTIAVVWSLGTLLERQAMAASPNSARATSTVRRLPARVLTYVFVALAVAVFGALAIRQVGFWRDDAGLFRHAIACTGPNAVAHKGLGAALLREGRRSEARAELEEAVRIAPTFAGAHAELCGLKILDADLEGAASACQASLQLLPGNVAALTNLGLVRLRQGRAQDAKPLLLQALAQRPGHAAALVNLGLVLMHDGQLEQAAGALEAALRSEPENVHAHINLGVALARLGRFDGAAAQFEEALRLAPGDATAKRNLDYVRSRSWRQQEPLD